MEPLSPATRRANLRLFTALILFAIVLAVVVFLWMRGVVKANGGIVDPHREGRSQKVESNPRDIARGVSTQKSRQRTVSFSGNRCLLPLPSSELLPSYFCLL